MPATTCVRDYAAALALLASMATAWAQTPFTLHGDMSRTTKVDYGLGYGKKRRW
ncbi:MAG: hypothetical protein SH859_13685 [Hyphomicrobium aestuarii]|nr:hypothetical protein [Hyphomicrobium aestuarii]